MLCALARSLVLFITLISTQLINAIFKIGRCWRSGALREGSYFFYIYADIDWGKEVEKVYLPLLAT